MPICCNSVIAWPPLWLTGKIRDVAFYCLWQSDELWLEASKSLSSNRLIFIRAGNDTWILGSYSLMLFVYSCSHWCSLPKYLQPALCLCITPPFIISRLKLKEINQYWRLKKNQEIDCLFLLSKKEMSEVRGSLTLGYGHALCYPAGLFCFTSSVVQRI